MIKRIACFLIISILSICDSSYAQTQPSSTQLRRNYPGGKDDSDLTVQFLRKITRKGESVEPEDHGHEETVEPVEAAPTPAGTPQNLGE